jgi:hypothetical protein
LKYDITQMDHDYLGSLVQQSIIIGNHLVSLELVENNSLEIKVSKEYTQKNQLLESKIISASKNPKGETNTYEMKNIILKCASFIW